MKTLLRPSWTVCSLGALATTLVLTSVVPVSADDWPQWRGPHRDGVLRESGIRDTLPEGDLPRRWTVPIGAGYSGPTVAEGRVYVTDRGIDEGETEVERVVCVDAATGNELWNHRYDAPYTIGYRAGPRASVTVHQGKAYSVGAMGHLKCLDAVTGEVAWEHDLQDEYRIRMPVWGITASPLVYQDLLIQVTGGKGDACVVAFDLQTGKERWRAINERAGYSAPVVIRQGDQDVVVCWTGESVTGLNPVDGSTHWQIPMLPRQMPIGVATPVVEENKIFVSSFYDGAMLIEFDSEKPEARQLWRRVGIDERNTDALHCMISTPLIKGDHIYGVDSYGQLRCLEMATGDRVWESDKAVPRNRWATIHTIRHGDREIMFNEQGVLMFAKLSPDGFQRLSASQLIAPTKKQLPRRDGVTWAHPAIANGDVYIRNDEELVCASLRSEHK